MQAAVSHAAPLRASAGCRNSPIALPALQCGPSQLAAPNLARSSTCSWGPMQAPCQAPLGLGSTTKLCRARGQRLVPTSSATASMYPEQDSGDAHNASTSAPAAGGVSLSSHPMAANLMAGLSAIAQAMAQLGGFLSSVLSKARSAVASVFPQVDNITAQDVHLQLRALSSNMKLLALVAPFARAASSESLTALYARTFERAAFGFAKMYLFCLFMRVLLSWFPGIDWNAQPWTFLRLITEPYLQIYRGILPPLFGQLDFTPLFGFLILQDVVEVMAPTYTMGLHDHDTSTRWTTSDVMCYFDGF